MKPKQLFLTCLLALVGSMAGTKANAYDAKIDGIYYNFSGNEATVTYFDGNYNSYSGAIVIPKSVTYNSNTYFVTGIGADAFKDCSSLTSITIPEGVTKIGSSAFADCYGLANISLPETIQEIGINAFWSCVNVRGINIPGLVTKIAANCFYNCKALTSITIPESVTSIDRGAFRYCASLASVTSRIERPFAFDSNAFEGISSEAVLKVPTGTRNKYIAAGWTENIFGGGIEESTAFYGFSNNKIYTLTCRRGGLVLNDDATGLAAGQIRTDETEADKHFAIIKYNGAQYLYSPVNKQYLLYDGSFVSRLGSPITFDDTHADGIYKFMISTQNEKGETLYFNNDNGFTVSGFVIADYDTPNDGNRWLIEPVADFNPAEAIVMAAAQTYTVTYNVMFDGIVVATATEEVAYGRVLPPVPASLSNKFITLTETGTHPTTVTEDVTVTYNATWKGPFEFTKAEESAKWYNLKIRGVWYVSKQDTEPYKPEYSINEDKRAMPAYQWAFGGDPYHVKIYNRTTGLNETLTKDGDMAVMRSGDYTWDLLPNNDGFVLRVTGTEYSCINQYGGDNGPLKFWTDSNSLTDDGSTFRVDETALDNTLAALDAKGLVGSKTTLAIALTNANDVSLCQFDLRLPEGVTVALNARNKLDATLTDRASTHTISSRQLSNGDYRFVVSSNDGDSFVGNEGTLMNIVLDIAEDAEAGNRIIRVLNIELSLPEGNDLKIVNPADAESTLTISSYKPGDVNGDDKVSVTDVGYAINYILEQVPSVFIFDAADMNHDGKISVTDVGYIINIILSDDGPSHARRKAAAQDMQQDGIATLAQSDTEHRLYVDAENCIGFQMDIMLPQGIELSAARLDAMS
ncbi:MAG: leucine-rich repeat protein, partial [Paludibacteraceae bacterium]|nr:leucine-rich repeat protein [Paludibacteraceae bacterium]